MKRALIIFLSVFLIFGNNGYANSNTPKISLDTISPNLNEVFLQDFIHSANTVLSDSVRLNNNYNPTISDLQSISLQMGYSDINDFCTRAIEVATYFTTNNTTTFINTQGLYCTEQLKTEVYACLCALPIEALVGAAVAVVATSLCLTKAYSNFKICCKYAQ